MPNQKTMDRKMTGIKRNNTLKNGVSEQYIELLDIVAEIIAFDLLKTTEPVTKEELNV